MAIKIIVTDVDGTLTRAGEVAKEGARDTLFSPHTSAFQSLAKEQWESAINQGGNRHDAIRAAFIAAHFPAEEIDGLVAVYAARYGDIAEELVVQGGVYPETVQALQDWKKSFPLYGVSVTPQESLDRTLEGLGLRRFFKKIYGASRSKNEDLQTIIADEGVSPKEVLLIGDGTTDERAAVATGCRFIGVKTTSNQWKDKPFPLVEKLTEVKSILTRERW
ncbi:MAG: haloacid dehalogenase [Parcubacteria group bacterium Gr01-1014_72]|nr:MAG: haloacid dehalogenase [Parcubacteria group bacterium Gr01-1014_72]